jgi:hypothetical protein
MRIRAVAVRVVEEYGAAVLLSRPLGEHLIEQRTIDDREAQKHGVARQATRRRPRVARTGRECDDERIRVGAAQ